MRSTNSSLIVGTHHIFFPPRLEAMVREGNPRCLSSQLRRDPSLHSLKRNKPDAPACAALRRRAADHRNDVGLPRAGQRTSGLEAAPVEQSDPAASPCEATLMKKPGAAKRAESGQFGAEHRVQTGDLRLGKALTRMCTEMQRESTRWNLKRS